jgi:hypothetical protein
MIQSFHRFFFIIDNFDTYFPSKCENIIKLIHMHVMFMQNLKEKMNSANYDKFHLVVIFIFHICKLYNGSLFWFKVNRNGKKFKLNQLICFKLHDYSLQMWPTMALQILNPMFIEKFDQMAPKNLHNLFMQMFRNFFMIFKILIWFII